MDISHFDGGENSSLSTSLDISPNLLELSSVSSFDHLENQVNPPFSESLNSKPELEDILPQDGLKSSQVLNTTANIANHEIIESLPDLNEKSIFTCQIKKNLLVLSKNSYNNDFLPPVFEVLKMQHSISPAGIPAQQESLVGTGLSIDSALQSTFLKRMKKRFRSLTTSEIPRSTLRENPPNFPSRRRSTGFIKILNKRFGNTGELVQTKAYRRSDTLEELQNDLPDLDLTVVQEINDFSIVVKDVTLQLQDNTQKNLWFRIVNNEINLSRKIYKNINFPKEVLSKNVLNIAKKLEKMKIKRKMRKQIETHLLRYNQNISDQIEIPSLIGFMDSFANLEKINTIYKHPYLLDILKKMKINGFKYSIKEIKNIDILIESCEFFQLGVQIDHLLPTAIRSAVYGHMFQSNNNRNNESIDSNWCIFMPLKKNGNKIVENLNSLRTAGKASNTLDKFNSSTDLKADFHELRDNGIMGNDFRIGLHQTKLTRDQKHKFLRQFTIAFEFVSEDSIIMMNQKYGMSSMMNQPPSYLLIILDLNIRFQRFNQIFKKIRNADFSNLIETEKIRDGLINVVQHKNTVLRLIELLYEENSLSDTVSVLEKEQLKTNIENDFLQLIFYPVENLINLDKSLFVMDNQLEKIFSKPIRVETSTLPIFYILTPEQIKSKKIEFIEQLKNKLSLLPIIPEDSKSGDLVNFFSMIRGQTDLFKHHGAKAMYVSSFNILQSATSLNKAESEIYENNEAENEIFENYESEPNDTISNNAISDNSSSFEDLSINENPSINED